MDDALARDVMAVVELQLLQMASAASRDLQQQTRNGMKGGPRGGAGKNSDHSDPKKG